MRSLPAASVCLCVLPPLAPAQVVTPPTERSPPFKNVRYEPEELSEELKEALRAREQEAKEEFERRERQRLEQNRLRELGEMRRDRRDELLTRIAHIRVPEIPSGELDRPADYIALALHPMLDEQTRSEAEAVLAKRQQRLREWILAGPDLAELLATDGLSPERLTDIGEIQAARAIIEPVTTTPGNDLAAELYARGLYGDLEHVMHEEIMLKYREREKEALTSRVGAMNLGTIGEFTSQALRAGAAEGLHAWDTLVEDTLAALNAAQRPLPEIEQQERLEQARAQVLASGNEELSTQVVRDLLAELPAEARQAVLNWAAQGQ